MNKCFVFVFILLKVYVLMNVNVNNVYMIWNIMFFKYLLYVLNLNELIFLLWIWNDYNEWIIIDKSNNLYLILNSKAPSAES